VSGTDISIISQLTRCWSYPFLYPQKSRMQAKETLCSKRSNRYLTIRIRLTSDRVDNGIQQIAWESARFTHNFLIGDCFSLKKILVSEKRHLHLLISGHFYSFLHSSLSESRMQLGVSGRADVSSVSTDSGLVKLIGHLSTNR
jgi:hypothetical protein